MSNSQANNAPQQSMSKDVAKGAAWSTLANIARISSALLVLPILARFLTPDEFGIMQIGMPIVLFLLMFNDFGFGPALVRAKNPSKDAWRSIFWTNFLIGIVMTLVLFFSAEPIANWFKVPESKSIIQALSFLILLNCLIITPSAELQRRMKFNVLSMIEVLSISLGIATALISAINGLGAWSLVSQQIVLFTVKAILMWIYARPPIKPTIVLDELRSFFGFSSNLMASRVVNFFARNADNLIIGRMLGTAALGFYSIAYRILLLPVEIFAWGLSQVLMPAMSKFHEDKSRMRAATLKTYRLISAFTFPTMAGISVLAVPLVITLLGERMAPAAIVLQILAPVGAIQSLGSTQGAMYTALGRADILFRLSLLGAVASIISFVIGVNWGLTGVATGYLIANILVTPYTFTRLLKIIELPIIDVLNAIRVPFIASLTMTAIVYLLLQLPLIASLNHFGKVFCLVPAGAITYIIAVWLMDKTLVNEILSIAKEVSSK